MEVNAEGWRTLSPAGEEMRICAFLWTYYGYPNSNYEGVNVEVMRYNNGEIMARDEITRGQLPKVDYVAGVPDPGCPTPSGMPTAAASPLPGPLSNTPPPGPGPSCLPIRRSATRWPR